MPMSEGFKQRLFPQLEAIAAHFGTPFHIYDEVGLRETGEAVKRAFAGIRDFREFFAVKALPNPHILRILREIGFGFDCSSVPELVLSRGVGAGGTDIMFTSNNTTMAEFTAAMADGGCILNLDDISLLRNLPAIPEQICFRYNPGARRTGNAIIGKPEEAKFGVSHDQLVEAYRQARDLGVNRFGLHTMLVSNERDHRYMLQTAEMLLGLVRELSEKLNITFDFINIGGGLGIAYRPEDMTLDIEALGQGIRALYAAFGENVPRLYMESGRFITGAHGVLVTRVINRKETYRTYVGVDASMSSLMRPGMYGAYHHVEPLHKRDTMETVDVVGSLCENNDKFAIQRELPQTEVGDLITIQDTGAHGHAMGFNYNGRLRPKELLLCADGSIKLIRRAETVEDYFATLQFEADSYRPS
jgi:diaminopimelate decarboxylase